MEWNGNACGSDFSIFHVVHILRFEIIARKIDGRTNISHVHLLFENISQTSLLYRFVCVLRAKKKNLTEQLGPLERAMILRNFSYTICVYRFRLVKMFESQHSYLCFLCIWSIEPQKQQREEKKLSLHLLCIIKETSKAKALVPLSKGESLREKRDRARKKREDE